MNVHLRRVALVRKPGSAAAVALGDAVAAWFAQAGVAVDLDRVRSGQDLAVILGGDGTLLHVADQAAPHGIPVVGINLGDLGFLTEVAADRWQEALAEIVGGRMVVEERMMLRARCLPAEGLPTPWRYGLNDVVASKDSVDRLLRLSAWRGDEEIATYRADGLIIATPTGSTAYSLSAGGPVVHPGLAGLVLTPICPFMLESRPVLLPADQPVYVSLAEAGADGVAVTVDGRFAWQITAGQRLEVAAAPRPLRLVRPATTDYFAILRRKLNWGGGPGRG